MAKSLNLTEIEQQLVESFDESIEDDRLFMLITNEYLNSNAEEKPGKKVKPDFAVRLR